MADDNDDIIEGEAREVALSDVDSSLAAALSGVEIDRQIATAHKFPRSLKRVTDNIFEMATLDKESAQESVYALPRGKGADRKAIIGPSIRFAEILQQSFGNCRAAARVVVVDRVDMFVEAEGVFHDLESNSATSARVRRPIRTSSGNLFSEDMIIVTGNAACSIAKRNAILGGVPKPLWRRAFNAVLETNRGDVATLTERRIEAVKAFHFYGVGPDQVFEALGVPGGEDITLDHIVILRGMFAALKNEEATVEQLFPPARSVLQKAQANTDLTQRLKEARAGQGGEPAEGFNASHGDKAKGDPLPGDSIPATGGGTATKATAESADPAVETAKSGEIRGEAPRVPLTQRVAAFKTLVDAAASPAAIRSLINENGKLWADVDAGDPDEVGTIAELDEYCSDAIASLESA